MTLRKRPMNVPGYVPGKAFTDTGEPFGLKVGLITRVDEVNLKADIKILTGGGDRYEIDLTQGMAGPRSFWGGVPEVSSLAIIGYRRISQQIYEAVILGYIPMGNKSGLRFDPFSAVDPNEVTTEDRPAVAAMAGGTKRFKRLTLKPGDVGGMSAAGAELVLSKDAIICNRAGDTIEMRDADRTLIIQSIHKVESQSGIKQLRGPIRRGAFFLPDDIFTNTPNISTDPNTPAPAVPITSPEPLQLKNETEHGYFGTDELQAAGPGELGSASKFANSTGVVLPLFNNYDEFPPVTYSNGRRVHYTPTTPAGNIESADSAADAFVEDRFEMYHTSDLTQEVLDEIDGFAATRRTVYIERVLGTVVGNDMTTTQGHRQYGQILKPRLFTDFAGTNPGKFQLEAVDRSPTAPDIESLTAAGAFLFRIRPPRGVGVNDFVAAVSKQGKLFLNIPASNVEDYPSGTKNISAEMNLGGALKAFIGTSAPDRISAHITCVGGIHLDVGRDAAGNAITVRYRSGVKSIYDGNPNADDVACEEQIVGIKQTSVTGAEVKTIQGSKNTIVSGMISNDCDRFLVNAQGGYSLNAGEKNEMISGKSQLQYAMAVLSTIVSGGEVKTVLAGGLVTTVAAGAMATTVAAGATSFNCAAGAFNIVVGTGAIAVSTSAGAVAISTASGALSLAAAAGAVAITAGLALNLTAGAACTIIAPIIVLGGPTAVLGVVRGIPTYPPGTPTLDYITGLPLLGAATVLSN